MKAFRPFFVIVAFVLMVGLACAFGGGGGAQSQPTQEKPTAQQPKDEPTQAETKPTEEATPSDATDEPISTDAQDFFTETFDGNIDNYTYFNTGKGDEDKMSVKTKDGSLIFDLKDNNLWIYVTYNPFTYKDVALEVTADNRGKNNNNISLFCRYNKEEGWYEFNIANSGLYQILAYDATGAVAKGYNRIADGASKFVKQGKDVNTYGATCSDDKLTLTINGNEVKTIKDTKYKFREGKVGFGVSSFDVTPILVNIDTFTISEP
jgi:Domain of Unknown Function (DUF1080)